MLKLKPWYAGLYIFVLSILILSSFLEYKSRYRDLLQLIQDQAGMTAAVIAQSGSGQAYLTEELKQVYIDRAIDILSIIKLIDSNRVIDPRSLSDLIGSETFLDITLLDKDGHIEQTMLGNQAAKLARNTHHSAWVQRQLRPILSQETDLMIMGVDSDEEIMSSKSATPQSKSQFLIAVSRERGGAIACHLSVEAEEDFKYMTAMKTALEDLLSVKGLQYLQLAVDEGEPYYVSKDSLRIDKSWSRVRIADILYSVSKGDTSLLEVVRPVFFESNLGEVRIGFRDDTLLNLRGQIIYQILLRSALLTVLAFVTLVFLLTRQNAALLEREKKRIEAEVFRLERLNRVREKHVAMGELAAGVAHEIRNPLNAIGIVAQRLKREFIPVEDKEEYLSMTGTMVSEIDRINHSLQDFLEYTKPTPLNISSVNTHDIFARLVDLYESETVEKEIKLQVEGHSFPIEADASYLQQALANLVKNSIQACEHGAEIKISSQKNGGEVILTVSDSGKGISKDQISRIFDLYYTTKDMGTGVGLALTHKIIADHNGTIEVESEVGAGTKFEIHLPVK